MFYLILVLLFIEHTMADLVAPRGFQGCVLNLNEIHCYGGFTSPPEGSAISFTNATNDHFFLDAETLNFTALSTAEQQWKYVARPPNRNTLPSLGGMSMTSIASHTQFILYGGFTEPHNQTLSTTIWKCSTNVNNSWSTPPSQGFYTNYSPVVDSGGSVIWTWGGLINATNIAAENTAYTFNYGRVGAKWSKLAGDPINGNVWMKHTATLVETNSRIYMMGGYEMQPGKDSNGTINQMTQIRWFDMNTNTWGMEQATVSGNQPITSRTLHTTTYIPGSTKLLVYGGYNDQEAKVCQDYAYVYDFMSKQYTPLDFNQTGPGPRASHSAVGYNSYIMILFGFDSDMKLQQDFNGLDVSDANHITWTTATPPMNHTDNNNSDNHSNGDSKLSSGATIGIAIAAAVILIGIVAGILYYFYRKKQQRQQFQLEQMDPRTASISGSPFDKFNGYGYLQKPTLEEESRTAYRLSGSLPSDQTAATIVTSNTTSSPNNPLKVKPAAQIDDAGASPTTIHPPSPHLFLYELADRNDSHYTIKPHDAYI